VVEYVLRRRPVSAGFSVADAELLIDHSAPLLDDSGDYPLDILTSMFPEGETVGIKIDGSSPGSAVITLAETLARRLFLVEVPEARVILWDRTARSLERAGLKVSDDAVPRCLSIAAAGGYGRPLSPKGSATGSPQMVLSRLAEKITRHVTVTALSARPDGTMAPFVIENLAGGVGTGEAKTPPSSGELAARAVSDEALMPRAALHMADLWRISLGHDRNGTPQAWEAGAVLISLDAVALTRVAHQILANTRRARGLGETPEPASLAEASRLGLGVSGLADINWRKVTF
jgi:hypothetical protein